VNTDQLFVALNQAKKYCEELREFDWCERINNRISGYNRSALRIVVFGEFNRGKSTLINALLGRQLLKAKLVPTTGTITQLCYEDTEQIEVYHRDGRVTTHAFNELETLSTLDPTGKARVDITSLVVKVKNEFLRNGVEIVDTPGVAEVEERTKIARTAIADADIVLFLLDARQLLREAERNEILEFQQELKKPILPIVNFLNMVEPSQVSEVRELLSQWCRDFSTPFQKAWLEVDAMAALKFAISGGPPPTDDFTALRRIIFNLKGHERKKLISQSRLNHIRYDTVMIERHNQAKLSKLDNDSQVKSKHRNASRLEFQHRASQLASLGQLTIENQLASAEIRLDTGLKSLIDQIDLSNGTELQMRLHSFYYDQFQQAGRDVEKKAHQALLLLAADQLTRPEPMTICENLILPAQMKVDPPATISATAQEVGVAVVIGGIIGTFLMPGAGTVGGVLVGGWLASRVGETSVDPLENFRQKVRETWPNDAKQLIGLLKAQLESKVQLIRDEVTNMLSTLELPLPADEIRDRRLLSACLYHCESHLNGLLRRTDEQHHTS